MWKFQVVIENNRSNNPALYAEHGLALYIEHPEYNILFDTGQSGRVLDNMHMLGIESDDIEITVLSHGHYDHAGGLRRLLEDGLDTPLYVGDGFFKEKYKQIGENCTYLGSGLTRLFLEEYAVDIHEVEDKVSLSEHLHLLRNFPGREDHDPVFLRRERNEMVVDDFRDEICLVIERDDDLIVCVGCSHPGIQNILKRVHDVFQKPIHTVLGGIHYAKRDAAECDALLDELEQFEVTTLALNHCSGATIVERAKARGLNCLSLGSGDTLFFD